MNLLKVDRLEEALEKLNNTAAVLPLETEKIPLLRSLGRILAGDIISSENVPGFDRSTVDGYAVYSPDTAGATESLPVFLQAVGEVKMGQAAQTLVNSGQCVYVPTGAMLPKGTDAVVMVEYCEPFGSDSIAVYNSVSAGRNVVKAGDDIGMGSVVLSRGRQIRPSDMGVMSAIGITEVSVYKPWKIIIISTGDEIVSPESTPIAGQVRDVNTYGLYGQAAEYGFQVLSCQVAGDSETRLKEMVSSAMKEADIVVISGGSSQGRKDATAAIIDELTSSGAFTHGIAVKPGKPTILGFDEPSATALIGLPGHPVAAVLLFRLMAGGLWERRTGMTENKQIPIKGRLTSNLPASPGRKTFQLVTISEEDGEIFVTPVLGKSGLISTMSRADGYIVMEVDEEGINRGEQVNVYR